MMIKDLFADRVFTISNLLSLSRIFIAPVISYFLYLENSTGDEKYLYYLSAGLVYIILSDFLDGKLARRLGQVSKLGQFLDPMADKISYLIYGFFMCLFKGFPWWLLGFALFREIVVVIIGLLFFSNMDIEVKPNFLGKICVATLALSAIVYTLSLSWSFMGVSIKDFCIFLNVLFFILGGIGYIKTYSSVYFDSKKNS
ncbi:MAG: CDP-alcohol phosphatidyltransferase family protein [Spirochaetes bacterium]|jgi:CDP-diacylglycerol--glycerol-3-phosphate 3-phosphatidyltransferase|nr:CDP-alcohol phosphatidyltransferase family protein [Spirochaetota bacterium]